MATIPRGPGANARRAEVMRNAWTRFEQQSSAVLGPIGKYLAAHPTLTQGVYYLLTGLWPLFALGSFVTVTGPKTDLWLVQTIGALVAVVGATLCVAAYRRQSSLEIVVLAVGCACVFAAVDLIFVVQRVISAIYLLDAAAEIGLLALWANAWGKGRLTWAAERSAPVAAPMAVPLSPTVPAGRNGHIGV